MKYDIKDENISSKQHIFKLLKPSFIKIITNKIMKLNGIKTNDNYK